MVTRVHLTALGVPVEVRVSGDRAAELAAAVRRSWTFCLAEPGASDRVVVETLLDSRPEVVEAARRRGVLAHDDLAVLVHELPPRVTLAAMERQAGSLLMFHACGLADPATGRVLAFVGPSGMGKTTAARTLATVLPGYVSDETVALRDDDSVVPYPKPLSVLTRTGRDLKAQVPPDEYGFTRADGALRLGRLAVLRRDPAGPRTPEVETLGALAAMAALSPHTSGLARLPRPLHRLADLLDRSGGLVGLRYRDAADLVSLVPDLLAGAR